MQIISDTINLPIYQLADELGYNNASFTHWLNGRKSPRLEQRLADFLSRCTEYKGMTPATLRLHVGLDPEPQQTPETQGAQP